MRPTCSFGIVALSGRQCLAGTSGTSGTCPGHVRRTELGMVDSEFGTFPTSGAQAGGVVYARKLPTITLVIVVKK